MCRYVDMDVARPKDLGTLDRSRGGLILPGRVKATLVPGWWPWGYAHTSRLHLSVSGVPWPARPTRADGDGMTKPL
jgi:hypothetical protein